MRHLVLAAVLVSTPAVGVECQTETEIEERAAISDYYFIERVERNGSTYVIYGTDTYIVFQFVDGCAVAYWYGLDHLLDLHGKE